MCRFVSSNITECVRVAFPFRHVTWSPNRLSTFQTYSYRLIRCVSVTSVTHVIFLSCLAHWGVPVWYFSKRKCRYDLYRSREVPVWHIVSYRPISSTGEIEQSAAELQRFRDWKFGGRPPSWIWQKVNFNNSATSNVPMMQQRSKFQHNRV